jgi:protein dithiol:quinone oxidoreductase
MRLTRRMANFSAAGVCALLLAYAYYLQHFTGLEPCPLCIFQRVAVFALGAVFLLAALHNPQGVGARVYAVLIGLVALAGSGVALRHIYIQNLPPGTVPECGATLDFMLEIFPVWDVITRVLTASGECGKVDWSFAGLSMPWWVLIWMVALGAFGVRANLLRVASAPSGLGPRSS